MVSCTHKHKLKTEYVSEYYIILSYSGEIFLQGGMHFPLCRILINARLTTIGESSMNDSFRINLIYSDKKE